MHQLFLNEIPTEVQQFGVFAGMGTIAFALIATVLGLLRLWAGPLLGWEIPGQPSPLNRALILPTAFFSALGFFYARPDTAWLVLIVGGILAIISSVATLWYVMLTVEFRRAKPVVAGNFVTKDIPVLAGDELTTWAKTEMKARHLTEEQIFRGTPENPYSADHVWEPKSRRRVFKKMMILFVISLCAGTISLAWLSFGVEVKVTGQPACAVLSPSQIPTGDPATSTKRAPH